MSLVGWRGGGIVDRILVALNGRVKCVLWRDAQVLYSQELAGAATKSEEVLVKGEA